MNATHPHWIKLLLCALLCAGCSTSASAQFCVYTPPELQGDYYFRGECITNEPGRHFLRTQIGSVSLATNELRWIIIRVPTNLPVVPAPLLLALHGRHHNAASMEGDRTNLIAAAEEKGVVLAFLNGSKSPDDNGRTWYACGYGLALLDLTYVEGAILWLQHFLPIDTRRTFISGFSGGAFMTQRVAADRPNRVRAAAALCSSSGLFDTNNNTYCGIPTPVAPISMFLLRGGQDVLVPPDGTTASEDGWIWDSVAEQMEFWITAAGGATNEVTSVQVHTDTTRQTYAGGRALVEMVFDQSLGHRWPETYDRPVLEWLLALPADPTIHQDGAKVVITYPSGTLQSAWLVNGPWTDVEGATSPYSMPRSEAGRYFRTRL